MGTKKTCVFDERLDYVLKITTPFLGLVINMIGKAYVIS